jgi:hypothetical protein
MVSQKVVGNMLGKNHTTGLVEKTTAHTLHNKKQAQDPEDIVHNIL